jgi:hypothetical protein
MLSQTEPLVRMFEQLAGKQLKLSKYTGSATQNFDQWLEEFELKTCTDSETTKLQVLRAHLVDEAREAYDGFTHEQQRNCQLALVALRSYFTKSKQSDWIKELAKLTMPVDMNFKLFGARITKAIHNAYPTICDSAACELMKIDYFTRGLSPELGAHVRASEPKDLGEAIHKATILEETLQASLQYYQTQNVAKRVNFEALNVAESTPKTSEPATITPEFQHFIVAFGQMVESVSSLARMFESDGRFHEKVLTLDQSKKKSLFYLWK